MLKQVWLNFLNRIKRRYRIINHGIHTRAAIKKWNKAGNTYPAPHPYRQYTLKEYAHKYKLDTLVETGTYQSDMPQNLQDEFAFIYTIELNIDYYLNAKEKFYSLPHIQVIKGESSEQIRHLMPGLNKPVLFWLDTHAWLENGLKELSVLKELDAILSSGYRHVILVNDARLFTGQHGYPALIDIRNHVAAMRPEYHFTVEKDIIRLEAGM